MSLLRPALRVLAVLLLASAPVKPAAPRTAAEAGAEARFTGPASQEFRVPGVQLQTPVLGLQLVPSLSPPLLAAPAAFATPSPVLRSGPHLGPVGAPAAAPPLLPLPLPSKSEAAPSDGFHPPDAAAAARELPGPEDVAGRQAYLERIFTGGKDRPSLEALLPEPGLSSARAREIVLDASMRDADGKAIYRELWTYGHSFPRHAPEVSDEQVIKRLHKPLRRGRAAGLRIATKFSNETSYVESARRAWIVLEQRLLLQGDARLRAALDQLISGKIDVMPDIHFTMERPVGYGFARGPAGVEKVDGLAQVCVKFARHGSSDRLYIKTIFPVSP